MRHIPSEPRLRLTGKLCGTLLTSNRPAEKSAQGFFPHAHPTGDRSVASYPCVSAGAGVPALLLRGGGLQVEQVCLAFFLSLSSPLPPPPAAAASPALSRSCLPGASSSSGTWRCSSAEQLLPLSGGGQVGDAPADAAAALRIRSHPGTASLNEAQINPAGEVGLLDRRAEQRVGGTWTLFHGRRAARAHIHTDARTRRSSVDSGASSVRSDTGFSCCSHLANSKKRTSQWTDTPTGRCHWPRRF